jgi:3'(2'), 5'-bisphosphate nucleotidase
MALNQQAEQFFKMVEANSSIVIFGHIWPDGDCYGSSEGLKYALQALYPEKKIKVSKTDNRIAEMGFPKADEVSDEEVRSSLHIVVDLPDKKRIGDIRAFSMPGTGIIKIDHHFFVEEFGGLEIVDQNAGSASDLIASILYLKTEHLPKVAATMFYLGITTDTGRFQFAYSSALFRTAMRLAEDGADISAIYNAAYMVSESSIQFKGYLYSHYQKTLFGVSYCKVPYKEAQKFGYDGHGAALQVNAIGNIEESRLFVIFGADKDGKVFCEMRSKGELVDVHRIAVMFGGGGHFNASGCTLKSMDEADKVIAECEKEVVKGFGPYGKELYDMVNCGLQASGKIMEIYKAGFEVEIKEDNSPVTLADKTSDKIIRQSLTALYPDYGMLTEEDADDFVRLQKEKVFIIDPLDGTADFVEKDGEFVINMALVADHVPVVGVCIFPVNGSVYFALKGQGAYLAEKGKMVKKICVSDVKEGLGVFASVHHETSLLKELLKKHEGEMRFLKKVGSAKKICLIAQGEGEACYTFGSGTKEWDTCAPQIILEEAGGLFTDSHGREIRYNRQDVYNRDGYRAVNRLESAFIKPEEIPEGEKK